MGGGCFSATTSAVGTNSARNELTYVRPRSRNWASTMCNVRRTFYMEQ